MFFFDNNISQKIPKALCILDEPGIAIHLTERFARDAEDKDWLPAIGAQRLFLVTRDKKIRKRPHELEAFRRANLGTFIFTGKTRNLWNEIVQIIMSWQEMKNRCQTIARPFTYEINMRRTFRRLF